MTYTGTKYTRRGIIHKFLSDNYSAGFIRKHTAGIVFMIVIYRLETGSRRWRSLATTWD